MLNGICVDEPAIVTAKTYFWEPAQSASARRRNEIRHCEKVALWFASLGLTVNVETDKVRAHGGDVEVIFSYTESCKNVYKRLAVMRNGRVSNITTLRKLQKEFYV